MVGQPEETPNGRVPAGQNREVQAQPLRIVTTLLEHVDRRAIDERDVAQVNENVDTTFLQPNDGFSQVVDRRNVVISPEQDDAYPILHGDPNLRVTLDQRRSVQKPPLD